MRKNDQYRDIIVRSRYGVILRASPALKEEVDWIKGHFRETRNVKLSDSAATEIMAREYKIWRNQKKFFGGGLF